MYEICSRNVTETSRRMAQKELILQKKLFFLDMGVETENCTTTDQIICRFEGPSKKCE